MRAVVIVLLTLTITTAGHPAPLEAAPPSSIRDAVALVAWHNPETDEYVPIGTAFHIGGGSFRTAAHVATAALPRRYEGRGFDQLGLFQANEFGTPSRYLGRVETTCVDPRWQGRGDGYVLPHDSAVLTLVDGPAPAQALLASRHQPVEGQVVSVWGFPQGTVLFEGRSTVSGVSAQWIRFRDSLGTPVIGGHSGSPTLDATGGVIAILVGGTRGVLAQNAAVPIRDAEQGCPLPGAGGPSTQEGH
jgi:hypothetical protein